VFGEETRSNHKQFLFRRIAWRIQANAWSSLSERARRRALEIANDADLRIRAPKNFLREPADNGRTAEARVKPSLDPRLPLPGTPLIRRYQDKDIIVHVRPDGGFECNGRIYKSLSRAVTEATGTRWNGFAFYGCAQRKSAGSARIGSDRSTGRGRNLVGGNGDVSTGEVTKSRGETDQ
jgi:hypothetical protein